MSTSDNRKTKHGNRFQDLVNLVIVLGLGVGVNALTHYPPGKVSISRSVLLEEDN